MKLAMAAAFALAVLPICVTPGVSFALVTQRVLDGGATSGMKVIAGTSLGLATHALLAGIGLAAIVMASSEAFTAIKLLGAVYLCLLGIRLLRASTRGAPSESPGRRTMPWSAWGDVAQGYLGNVLNPKAAAVYLTLAPQFIDRTEPVVPQMAALCVAHIVVGAGWLLIWTAVVMVTRQALQGSKLRRGMNRVSGVVLVALGVRAGVAAR